MLIGNNVQSAIIQYRDISFTDVRPSVTATINVAGSVLRERPLLGVGPNRFARVWSRGAPALNNQFNGVRFNFGFGYIPTFFITTGVLGLLAWIGFLVFFISAGLRRVFFFKERSSSDTSSHYFLVASFMLALYLWIFAAIYVVSASIIFLAFLLTGVFAGIAFQHLPYHQKAINFSKDPRTTFMSMLILLIAIALLLWGIFGISRKAISHKYFFKAQELITSSSDLNEGLGVLEQAIRINPHDSYYRLLVNGQRQNLEGALSDQESFAQISENTLQNAFVTMLGNAQQALSFDSTNALNWRCAR